MFTSFTCRPRPSHGQVICARNGSRDDLDRTGPVLLLGVPGGSEGAGDDPLRTQLLPGLHRGLLGSAEEPVQLPAVQAGVQPQTPAEQKHGPRRGGGEVPTVRLSGPTAGRGGEVQRVQGEDSRGRQVLPAVRPVVLRDSPETPPHEVSRGQRPQVDPGHGGSGRSPVPPSPQLAGAVLPHRPGLRVSPMREGETQESRHGVAGGAKGSAAGAGLQFPSEKHIF